MGKNISTKPSETKNKFVAIKFLVYVATIYCVGILMGLKAFSAQMTGWLIACFVFITTMLLLKKMLGFNLPHIKTSSEVSYDSIESASTTSITTKTSLGGEY